MHVFVALGRDECPRLDVGGESVEYLNIMYEGYAPGGVALMIECLTDNKNRAAAEVRTALSRNGGTLADPGSVAYNFTRKGVIVVSEEGTTEEQSSASTEEDETAEQGPSPQTVQRIEWGTVSVLGFGALLEGLATKDRHGLLGPTADARDRAWRLALAAYADGAAR